MTEYNICYFSTSRGTEPVKEFIKRQERPTRQKFYRKIDYLKQSGPNLPYPHAKCIKPTLIYELIPGPIRVLYFFYQGNNIILTNAFRKTKQKTPKREIELAMYRRKIFLAREK